MSNALKDTKICMFLMGGLLHDGRVRKESSSLRDHGAAVTVLTLPDAPENGAGLSGIAVRESRLTTRRLASGRLGLVVKYAEYALRMMFKGAATRARIFHAHDLPTLLPAYLASRLRRGRLVYDAHELFTERGSTIPGNGVWRRLERWLLKKVDGVLTTNESRARIIHEEYGAVTLPVPIYNCPVLVGTDRGESPLRSFVHEQAPHCRHIVFTHGAISPGRQCEELIDAAQHLPTDSAVVFLGYGSTEAYVEELRQRAQAQEGGATVLFHPAVPNDRIADYTRGADVGIVFYANTCRNNYYCASNKLFDFLMVGVPVVGSDIAGITEVVHDRNVGLAVDSTDAAAIGAAINDLLSHDDERVRMAATALELAKTRYNWGRQEDVLVAFYRDLIAASDKAA